MLRVNLHAAHTIFPLNICKPPPPLVACMRLSHLQAIAGIEEIAIAFCDNENRGTTVACVRAEDLHIALQSRNGTPAAFLACSCRV